MIASTLQIGHLHPLVVHLPIGILLIGFVLELLHRKNNNEVAQNMIGVVLLAGFVSSALSLVTGWFLGDNGGYDEGLLFLHRWWAVTFTIFCGLLYFLKKFKSALASKAYFPLFLITLLTIGITGHYGGSMTHGEDYLFVENSTKKIVIEDVEKAIVYTDIIQPIFDAKCVSCHNTSKIKGGLLMDTKENLLKGGDSGSTLDSMPNGEPSLLLAHLRLPLEHEDHMPPKGKVQPTSDELALLEWWMENDHCFDCVAGTLDKSPKIAGILTSLEEDTSTRALIAKNLEPVPQDWLAQLNSVKISAMPLAENNPLVQVSLQGRKDLTKKDFKFLKKYAENIVELNLGNSNFNDTLAKALGSFKNLTKLQLQNSPIGIETVQRLEGLTFLESLNLYGTPLNDGLFTSLEKLPNLKSVYLFQTQISQGAMRAFAKKNETIKVQGQVDGEMFRPTSLDPPNILSDTQFFKDSVLVTLDYAFDDIGIHYTLDGSIPDSTATKYSNPFYIKQSLNVTACTYAPGWDPSEPNSISFKKFKFDLASVSIDKKPNDRYKANGANTLTDFKRGSFQFHPGKLVRI